MFKTSYTIEELTKLKKLDIAAMAPLICDNASFLNPISDKVLEESLEYLGESYKILTEQVYEEKIKSGELSREEFEEQRDKAWELNKQAVKDKSPILPRLGYPPEVRQALYLQAFNLYQGGKFEEAKTIFLNLVRMDPMDPKHCKGLAATLHQMGDYKEAIKQYNIAAIFDPTDPTLYYHSIDCCLKIDDLIAAHVMTGLTIEHSGNKKEFKAIKEQAKVLRETIKERYLKENKKKGKKKSKKSKKGGK